MRNPIRLKNLRPRYIPYFLIGIAVIVLRRPPLEGFALGVPVVLLGLTLRSWAAGHLVKNDRLTTTGPYAHLRHPLYLGTLLVATGFALILGGYFALAALAFIWPWFALHYFPRKDLAESARLAALHGDVFARYRAAVPALWPRPGGRRDPQRSAGAGAAIASAGWQLERYSDNNELGTVLAIAAALVVLALRAAWGGR
ncbi:isoprenylcysteine carboxylmethyltransferase family protein [Myxococcota bacterium]|nr:isoprenylcysteine carboxylmethyltransferase family protein [Myxococcota bacterium]